MAEEDKTDEMDNVPIDNQGEGYQLIGGQFTPQKDPLNFTIQGRPAFTYANVVLNGDDQKKILTDGEAMLWMDGEGPQFWMETECYGGLAASCMRACSGESCCMNTFHGTGKLAVGFEEPGDMLAFGVTRGQGWALTRRAFVAGTDNIKVSAKFSGCLPCMCTDEGAFLTTVEIDEEATDDNGVFLAGSYGFLEKHELKQGQKMYVAKGSFFASHSSTELKVSQVGGITNFCCGASWRSIVLEFSGPCTVYTQSRNPEDLRRMQMASMQAKEGGNNNEESGGHGGDGGE